MKTADEIFEEMRASFEEAAGSGINGSCDMAVRLRAAAEAVADAYAYAERVNAQCFPQTAEGEYLDRHAEMRGITRIPAAKASGSIKFTIRAALATALTVAADTVCMTASGLAFKTTESAVIAAGSLEGTAAAECAEAGRAGNAAAGTIVYMTAAPVGVSACTNEAAFTGGRDAESDGELRARVTASFRTLPNGANAAYYEQEALAVDGAAAAAVLPRARGIGTVDVVVSGNSGAPSAELLAAVLARLNASREICADIDVLAPTAVTVNVSASVDVEDGYAAAAVRTAAAAALEAYFNGRLLGKDVLRAKLGSIIYGVEGVKNYTLTLPAADVAIDGDELPVKGTVTVSAWS